MTLTLTITMAMAKSRLTLTIAILLLETCFWNVVNVHAQLKCKLFIDNVVVNVMHTLLYCM